MPSYTPCLKLTEPTSRTEYQIEPNIDECIDDGIANMLNESKNELSLVQIALISK
jgi:hypothetical protein